ncbi:MAG: ABC transporter ATP-binding protein [SAR324 cluster bacterium]|nr:ABC transporter ATP-binding protein [SAR324 cluster bacterium]
MNFELKKGDSLGIVGESGSGKTTVARIISGLETHTSGKVHLLGKPLSQWLQENPVEFRKSIQYVFQDPIMSLNPRKTIYQTLEKPLKNLTELSGQERKERIEKLMELVNLRPEFVHRYPHEFSGGQCQRIGIARALASEPKILVLDEPVSALDVSIQAQILNLLMDLKEKLALTYVFISHDLSVVEFICDRILVMNRGYVVEEGDCDSVFRNPREDYTRKLIASIPLIQFS